MKKTLLIALLLSAFQFAEGQKVNETDVPSAVKATFKLQCPGVTTSKWEKEDGNFEAHYSKGNNKMTCVINPSGTYVQSELAIDASGLPKAARDYLTKKLAGKKVSEAAKITGSNGKVTFEAEVKDVDYTFDSDGTFLKQEADND